MTSTDLPDDTRALSRAARKLVRKAGAQLGGRYHGPDPQVRRDSYDVDDPRAQVARRLADGTREGTLAYIDAMVRTAQEFDDRERSKGEARPLKASGIRVLEAVLRHHWHDFKTGDIDPALSQIAKATALVKQTVVSALRRLARHGFLDWVRRTVKVDVPVAGGPTRQQTNNAYLVNISRLASDVRMRFLQLYGKAKERLIIRRTLAAAATSAAPPQGAPVRPSPAAPADPELRRVLAALGEAVSRKSPSPEIGQSPAQGA